MITQLPRKEHFLLFVLFTFVSTFSATAQTDTVTVNMVALDQPFMFNRLGAAQPTGQIFALERDVVETGTNTRISDLTIAEKKKLAGKVSLREGKRPRPIVLRANKGQFLKINFINLLSPGPRHNTYGDSIAGDNISPYLRTQTTDSIKLYSNTDSLDQNPLYKFLPMTRMAGVHCMGLEVADNVTSNSNWVGVNANGMVLPGKSTTYKLIAAEEGSFMLYSNAAPFDGRKTLFGGQLSSGLFGSVVVQPENSEYYRSQVSGETFFYATKEWIEYDETTKKKKGTIPNPYYGTVSSPSEKPYKASNYSGFVNAQGFPTSGTAGSTYYPKIEYKNAAYPTGYPGVEKNQAVLSMVDANNELIYTDLTALITGPNAGNWSAQDTASSFLENPVYPNRRSPYREYAIHYHEAFDAVQAFPIFYDAKYSAVLSSGRDDFAINYGTGGIGAEIYANRIEVGPMKECVECAYEEFFLSSWAVGDPAMMVNTPSNVPGGNNATQDSVNYYLQELLKEATGQTTSIDNTRTIDVRTNLKPLYPDDPSNVYHSYMNDHVVFRVNHGGPGLPHVHHQHAHQWLHSPKNDDGHYLDSQGITPGSSYTLDIAYGSGNLNKTVGDQIFHCHFYPHFAAGMWGMWRVHDVLEVGTKIGSTGEAVAGARAYPDVEITKGTFIPGLIPMPTQAMAPVPSEVALDDNGQIVVKDTTRNPGYPFYIPGVAGQRAPNPPMDFAVGEQFDIKGNSLGNGPLNGGLPRSIFYVAEGKSLDDYVLFESHNQYDWTKLTGNLDAIQLPENGTASERVAMRTHAIRNHYTLDPSGNAGTFTLNGQPAVAGAPFADPAVKYDGSPISEEKKRIYKAAGIEMDVILNKAGWHYPQQRFEVLWGDVAATMSNVRPPEPFFFRANSEEFIEFWHTNLVPEYYELDDYQVRTPTDILGQHIHLVKFDVTSSDGAANGWNYEDGTLSPGKVQERIHAINNGGSVKKYTYSKSKSILAGASSYASAGNLTLQGPNPVWGSPPEKGAWDGANTTIQRWYADPILNNAGDDRTLRTVFTHDHFGPSTHQQVGYYSGLLVEPARSTWIDPMSGETMGERSEIISEGAPLTYVPKARKVDTAYISGVAKGSPMLVQDGGPTSWQANIITENTDSSYRELMLEFQDMQFAYYPGGRKTNSTETNYPEWEDGDTPDKFKKKVANNYLGYYDPNYAVFPSPAPEVITSHVAKGTQSLNYRNEPLPLRLAQTVNWKGSDTSTGIGTLPGSKYHMTTPISSNDSTVLKPGKTVSYTFNQGDPTKIKHNSSYALSSSIQDRELYYVINGDTNKFLQSQPTPGYSYSADNGVIPYQPIAADMQAGDPYTPLFRAYEGDKIQVRTLVGAHVSPHTFYMHGVKWLAEPSATNSGYKASQTMGISEHFEMEFKLPQTGEPTADYLYATSIDDNGIKNGSWGLMRAYNNSTDQVKLERLPNNPKSSKKEASEKKAVGCPTDAPIRNVNVTAIWAQDLGRPNGVVYNDLSNQTGTAGNISNGMIFIPTELESKIKADPNMPLEPLVIRARAGECINLTLKNKLRDTVPQKPYSFGNMQGFRPSLPSYSIGLHADLVSYSVQSGDGVNVGLNNIQTVDPGGSSTVSWYCGTYDEDGNAHPAEFGAVNLSPPDIMSQSYVGLYGALVVLPEKSYWTVDNHLPNDSNSAAATSATVYKTKKDMKDGKNPWFRDCVLMFEDNYNAGSYFYQPSINYKNASIWSRYNYAANYMGNPILGVNTDSIVNNKGKTVANPIKVNQGTRMNSFNVAQANSNSLVYDDPQTPVLVAEAGDEVRVRLLHTYGSAEGITFTLDGHVWQEEPWNKSSGSTLGSTKMEYNKMSEWKGATAMVMAMTNYQVLLKSAGGSKKVPGDYQYRSFPSQMYSNGTWGILRVLPKGNNHNVQINRMELNSDSTKMNLYGNVSVNTLTGEYPNTVTLQYKKGSTWTSLGTANVNNSTNSNGKWGNWEITGTTLSNITSLGPDTEFRINSSGDVNSKSYTYDVLNHEHASFRPLSNKVVSN